VSGLRPPPVRAEVADVGTIWRSPGPRAAVLVLAVGARPAAVLDGLRRAGVARVDLVVAPVGGSSVEALVTVVRQRVRIDRVWLPGPSGRASSGWAPTVPGGRRPAVGAGTTLG